MSKMGRDNRTKWSIDKLFLFVTKKNSPSIFERTKCDLIKRRNDRSKSGTRYPRSAGAILSRNFIRQKQSGRRERRRPNPLRFAGRVFNFQDHQYVPRNPPAMLLQSLLPCSPLSLSFYLVLSSLFPSVASPRPTGFLLPRSHPLPPFQRALSMPPPRPEGCCVHLSFRRTIPASKWTWPLLFYSLPCFNEY